jgi:hypothetical protein
MEIFAADVENTYLNAPITEKIWTICGVKFGTNQGKKTLIVWALYGLKSAGAAFQNHLTLCIINLKYKPCFASNDIWYCPNVREAVSFEYYE